MADFPGILLRLALEMLPTREFIDQVMPTDPIRVADISQRFFGSGGPVDQRVAFADHLANCMRQTPLTDVANRHYLQAEIALLRGEPAAGIDELQKAVQLNPQFVPWRYRLAQTQLETGDLTGALVNARVCVRLRPANPKHMRLVRRIQREVGRS